jgi:hypothetical protein
MQGALFAAGLVASMISTSAYAVLFVPAGLAPGDSYQLAFVTSVGTNATSSDINSYNSFVQAAADAAGIGSSEGVTWSAIASTSAINANSNAMVSTKVFNMGGQEVATGYTDFWDGSHTLGVGIDFTEHGVGQGGNVWTGSNTDGTGAGIAGINVLGNAVANWGEATSSGTNWISRGTQPTSVNYSLYALSETLTVPVPEPETYAMLLAGLGLVGGAVRRRKQAEA